MATQTPQFVDTNVQTIIEEIVADYELRTGTTLAPASVERLLINSFAYREGLVRASIQSAALQNLVAFAEAPVLDYLGELVGVFRLSAAPATCTLRFILVPGQGNVIIPAGTRVQTIDGNATFQTLADVPVLSGTNEVDILGEATAAGIVANGYEAGKVSTLLDPQAFLQLVSNLETTAGGSDTESDTGLRERIELAPSSFSVAGPKNAYKFWARTASSAIIDVGVTSPTPGTVYVFPLMEDGSVTPQQILDAVFAVVNADDIRPLTDTVVVESPTRLDYTLTVELTLYIGADATNTLAAVQSALQVFIDSRRQSLGQDIKLSQLIAQAQVAGVYSVDLVGWSDIIVDETEFAFNTALNISVVGFNIG
jgi:phage-related baseplate assembly protein